MDKKKIIYIVSSSSLLVLVAGMIFWIVRKETGIKKSGSQIEISGNNKISEESTLFSEEADYKVESKSDANKALEDLDGLVKSAGETSL